MTNNPHQPGTDWYDQWESSTGAEWADETATYPALRDVLPPLRPATGTNPRTGGYRPSDRHTRRQPHRAQRLFWWAMAILSGYMCDEARIHAHPGWSILFLIMTITCVYTSFMRTEPRKH